MEAERAKAAAAAGSSSEQNPAPPTSPQVSLEEMSLQQSMDRNKESLKRKLMLRRSVNELVDQGIYPPLKTPPAFAEQQKKLERAKTGDLLKHKIQQRPDRNALVQQHILEDSSPKIDPSLADRQRQLKRARLLDGLNVRLSHRPGPLELVQSNILPSENNIKEAINDGILQFNKTFDSDDEPHFTFDEDSNTSEGAPSPPQNDDSSMSDVSSPNSSIPPAPELPINLHKQQVAMGQLPTFTTVTTSVPISNGAHTGTVIAHSGNNVTSPKNGSSVSNGNHNITKARPKKQKLKTQPKSKVIKFHEYKGPPNSKSPGAAQVVNASNNSETPYHILLQQQQLFLQWQLEIQQKNMPFLLSTQPAVEGQPAVSAQHSSVSIPSSMVVTTVVPSVSKPTIHSQVVSQTIPPPPPPLPKAHTPPVLNEPQQSRNQIKQCTPPPPSPAIPSLNSSKVDKPAVKQLSNLEEMKVADLKAELKKRNLPVSGSKPQLIERLKPYVDGIIGSASVTVSSSDNTPVSLPKLKPIDTNNIKTEIKTECICSPDEFSSSMNSPNSPPFLEQALTPMSPELMDLSSSMTAHQIRSNIELNQNLIPMAVDRSRPPSVVPVDMAPMEIDQVINDGTNSLTNFQTVVLTPQSSVSRPESVQSIQPTQLSPQSPTQIQVSPISIHNPSPLPWQIPVSTQQTSPQPHIQVISQNHTQQQIQALLNQQKQSLLNQQHNAINLKETRNCLSPPAQGTNNSAPITHEELLQQQQQKIADLQRQLEELQQLQQQHQHHLQTTLLKQPSSPQLQKTIQVSVGNDNQSPVLQQVTANTSAVSQTLSQQVVQLCEVVASSSSPLSSMIFTGGTDVIKPHLPNIIKSPPFQQNKDLINAENTIGKALPNILLSTSIPSSASSSITPTLNGLTPVASSRSSSVPPSSDEGIPNLQRTISSPFFAFPMKEPPKYHEAIKTLGKQPLLKQQSQQNSNNNNLPAIGSQPVSTNISFPGNLNIRSQEMDDLLDILIKNGELPPSALLTPKTVECVSLSTASVTQADAASDSSSNIASCTVVSSGLTTITTSSVPLNLHSESPHSLESTSRKKDVTLPLIGNTTDNDFLELNAMLNSDFTGMDWTSETFSSLDLPDTNMTTDPVKSDLSSDLVQLHVPSPGVSKPNPSGSEPDLVNLGLNETQNNMQIDVSDWLDVIMPSTGLTPLSANAPVSFTTDPVLSTKSNQEVYDLFSFDDSDLTNPIDSHCTLNWDKLTEASTSS